MKLILFLFACTLIFATSTFAKPYTPPTSSEIEEAQRTFKFRGQWIHPKIIESFIPWVSDQRPPLIQSMDAAAAMGTNQFSGAVKAEGSKVSCKADDRTFSYEWQGRLKNGMHVLVTRDYNDRGTMVYTNLVVLSIQSRQAKDETNKPYNQLLLNSEKVIGLGDRSMPTVSIKENSLSVDNHCEKTCEVLKATYKFD